MKEAASTSDLFVTQLADLLRASPRPVVVNTAVPGAAANAIAFDDLELAHRYTFRRSNAQQRRANELLGIPATQKIPELSYVTWGPSGLVRTSFAGDVGPLMKFGASVLGKIAGKRADTAVQPIIGLIDDPTPGRRAYRGSGRIALVDGGCDEKDAVRLVSAVDDAL